MKSNAVEMTISVSSETKEAIEAAAQLTGQTIDDFTSSVLAERAFEVIDGHRTHTISLSNRDRDIFLAMLADENAVPNEALLNAAREYKQIIERRGR